ncbi:MAG TPA: TetR/AcrR family transcriptional regulator [Pseudolysinimonas sp.]|nr:TetR/AcrR family transcriptional regulator [Pseudolysinimonas sp.]
MISARDAFVDTKAFSRARAQRMTPDDRREALVTAVMPLIQQFGRDISTRQIAEAAEVAEGTIFRVFPDKDSLIDAVVDKMLDQEHLNRALRGIDPTLPLEQKLHSILFHLRSRFTEVFHLMAALGMHGPPKRPRREEWREIIADLLRPDEDRLSVSADQVAVYLRMIAFSASIPAVNEPYVFTTDELAALVISGVAGKKD